MIKKFKYQQPGFKSYHEVDDNTKKLRRKLLDIVRSRKVNYRRSEEEIIKFVGINLKGLIQHLEKKFYKNPETEEMMSWENHGIKGWHIDHIKPCNSFDLSNENEAQKCFHYTNLQPLWSKENIKKGGMKK